MLSLLYSLRVSETFCVGLSYYADLSKDQGRDYKLITPHRFRYTMESFYKHPNFYTHITLICACNSLVLFSIWKAFIFMSFSCIPGTPGTYIN